LLISGSTKGRIRRGELPASPFAILDLPSSLRFLLRLLPSVLCLAALIDAQDAIDARAELYDHPETGLKSQFQQAKAAVASQFGRRSTEYQTVSSLRY
jgi:hypothetical protein